MLVRHSILRHWKKQVQVFRKNFALARQPGQTNAIHDLRVAVKKMRSYLRLLNLSRRDNYSLAFDGTEKLFSIMGKYRDVEMGLTIVQAYEKKHAASYKIFHDHLSVILLQQNQWLQAAILEYDQNELNQLTWQLEQDLRETGTQELLIKFKEVVAKEFKKAARHTHHFDQHTHQIRKIFKEIFYWAELAPAGELLEKTQAEKIKQALKYLGDWQDHDMLYKKLRHFRKDFVPSVKEEHQLIRGLENDMLEKQAKLLNKAKDIADF